MESPFQRSSVDPQLACEFLGVFARFEYALKVGGFAVGDANHVDPDWDRFARAVGATFAPAHDAELAAAVDYLLARPPKKQVLVNGRVVWRDAPAAENLSKSEQVLLMVRRVRNNLFHGGKLLPPEAVDVGRDQLLVRHSLTVLRACRHLHAEVSATYGM